MFQRYYEFDEQEYYALISLTIDGDEYCKLIVESESEEDMDKRIHRKAAEIYIRELTGEDVEGFPDERLLTERTKEYALIRFVGENTDELNEYEDLVHQFEQVENGVLLIQYY